MPFDLNQARANRAEEDHEPYEFVVGKDTFTAPHPVDWDRDVLAAFAAENLDLAFQLLLGPAQFRKFLRHKPKLGDYIDLMDDMERHAGMAGRGESPEPGPSSRPTGVRSKRTSTATTGRSSAGRPGRAGRNLKPAAAPAGTSGE